MDISIENQGIEKKLNLMIQFINRNYAKNGLKLTFEFNGCVLHANGLRQECSSYCTLLELMKLALDKSQHQR